MHTGKKGTHRNHSVGWGLRKEMRAPETTALFQNNRQIAQGTAACFLLGRLLGGLLQKPLLYTVRAAWRRCFGTQRKLQLLSADSEGFPMMWGMYQRQWAQRESLKWDTAAWWEGGQNWVGCFGFSLNRLNHIQDLELKLKVFVVCITFVI